MNDNLCNPFELFAKVLFNNSDKVYTIKSIIKYRGGYVYLLHLEGFHTSSSCIATHEQLQPYIDIMIGDSVIWNTGSFTITGISPNYTTCTLRGVHQIVKMNQLALVKRATAIEFDNAVRKIYGAGSNMLETDDNIKMGYVEMKYGQIVYDEIIRARKENTKHKR